MNPISSNKQALFKIQDLLDQIKDRGYFVLAHLSEEDQVLITHWAQDIFDRYESVLKNQPSKIKNIVELPASKQELKMAVKILLTAYVFKESYEIVDKLKDRYTSIGAFQKIDLEDGEKKSYEVNNFEEELESDYASVFPEYHKHIEVIISEQNVLLDDVNNFINDLLELKNKS
ncbi:MAG: hypothetical protein PVF37_09285 [Desulfobacterales bacterium]|jgi:hypothetical protein